MKFIQIVLNHHALTLIELTQNDINFTNAEASFQTSKVPNSRNLHPNFIQFCNLLNNIQNWHHNSYNLLNNNYNSRLGTGISHKLADGGLNRSPHLKKKSNAPQNSRGICQKALTGTFGQNWDFGRSDTLVVSFTLCESFMIKLQV